MKKRALPIVLGLMALGTVAMLGTGCTVTVSRSNEPTTAPPAAPVVSLTCAPNQYLRGGKHVWRNGAWRWVAPRCVARTATWRQGCRWTRGHWVRRGQRYVFRKGRLVCPRRVVRVRGPKTAPPAPPAVRVTCAPNQYLRGGKHVWRGGRWVWVAPRCVARTKTWRRGCVWRRGGWKRVNGRLRYHKGRLFCPKAVPLRVVHPTMLPPSRPPKNYRRVRCPRNKRYYPGRYTWNNRARQYVWTAGRCIAKRRGCRWVKGRWAYHNGRSYYIRPAWRCRGKLTYVGRNGTWKPGPAYGGFIKRRPCGRNRYRAANGRCVRYKRRCPANMVLRRGRCFRRPTFKRCGRGWVLRAGRCVRRAGAARPVGRCGRFMAMRRGKCVRVACPDGMVLRRGKCYRGKKCGRNMVRRGGKCVRTRCAPGMVLRNGKCYRGKKCGRNMALRGNKCVRIRCPRGMLLRGGKCVRGKRGKSIKCKRFHAVRGGKCVRVKCPGKMKLRRGRCYRK